ncbi:MAG: HAMP domain-containing protein, partial [Acidobacteriota bacterium]|nr:HAMP domain-containing protein [Acidobacteriota bacterium]
MRFRLPRRTARLRLTALYGGLFLLSGVALVSGTYVLFERATVYRAPQLPKVPQAPTLAPLPSPQLPQAVYRLTQRLAQDQLRLATLLPKRGFGPPFATPQLAQLARDQRRLTEDQRRLSAAVHQLAQAERQVAQAGSVQAAQRASDAHALLVDSGIALAALGILALAGGWFLAGRMLQPIRTITRTARRISSSSLHERLALDGPQDELKELGDPPLIETIREVGYRIGEP